MNDYARFDSDVYDESNRPAPVEIDLGGHDEDIMTPFESFMLTPERIGANVEIGDEDGFDDQDAAMARATGYDAHYEIGDDVPESQIEDEATGFDAHYEIGDDEVGANIEIGANTEIGKALAVRAVLETARDNRSPAPPMRAVDLDAPERSLDNDWLLADTCIGAAVSTGNPNPYPLLAKYMQKAGAGMPPRIVRVDTEESYNEFRAADSPERAAFQRRLEELEHKFAAHSHDPWAHERLTEEFDDLSWLGEKAAEAQAEKHIEMDLLPGAKGKHDQWTDEEDIFASIKIPHEDGGIWWLTAVEPWEKSVKEASRHAAESNASASAVGELIPSVGERLGAGTAIKEMVAATPSILKRPEAKGRAPFLVRIEPAMNPTLCALALLAIDCAEGNAQACDEWNRLSLSAPTEIKQAMTEAVAALKKRS